MLQISYMQNTSEYQIRKRIIEVARKYVGKRDYRSSKQKVDFSKRVNCYEFVSMVLKEIGVQDFPSKHILYMWESKLMPEVENPKIADLVFTFKPDDEIRYEFPEIKIEDLQQQQQIVIPGAPTHVGFYFFDRYDETEKIIHSSKAHGGIIGTSLREIPLEITRRYRSISSYLTDL